MSDYWANLQTHFQCVPLQVHLCWRWMEKINADLRNSSRTSRSRLYLEQIYITVCPFAKFLPWLVWTYFHQWLKPIRVNLPSSPIELCVVLSNSPSDLLLFLNRFIWVLFFFLSLVSVYFKFLCAFISGFCQ